MFSNFAFLLCLCIQLTSLPLVLSAVGMVLQGETRSWLKITLRQVYRDVILGETPVCSVPGMLLRAGTPLWNLEAA